MPSDGSMITVADSFIGRFNRSCNRDEASPFADLALMLEYKVLKEIETNPRHTQRTLAGNLGVSLGKINYIISGLVEKGIVRVKKLTNEPGSIRWHYLLTPEGIKEKWRITRSYLARRKAEYAALEREIAELERELGSRQ